jgi:hypothetical protein
MPWFVSFQLPSEAEAAPCHVVGNDATEAAASAAVLATDFPDATIGEPYEATHVESRAWPRELVRVDRRDGSSFVIWTDGTIKEDA